MAVPRGDRPFLLMMLLSLLLAFGPAFAQQPVSRQRGASVSLRAKWEGTSVLLEAGEFLADEDLSKFWNFVEAVDGGAVAGGNGTCWSRVLKLAAKELSPQLTKVLESFVALRYHSPRLEMMRGLASPPTKDLCCWVSVGNTVLGASEGLREKVAAAVASGEAEQLYSFDHLYGDGADGADAPGAALFGAPGTPCFSAMHRELAALAKEGVVRYALRPYLGRGCAAQAPSKELAECLELGTGEALPLPGYGVELAIKNMEYKAMDDSEMKAKGQGDKDAEEDEEELLGEELSGFLFGRLLERKPESKADLMAFRDHLLAQKNSAEDETLKVWQVKDLGLQAVQRVAESKDPLRLLADVSQNFPSRATSLSRLAVDSALRAEVKRIQQSLPSGTNFLLLNGLMVEVDTLELYSLVERVRHDMRLSQRLEASGIPTEAIPTLLALRPSLAKEGEDDIRIDLGSKVPVRFLNNLEKDRMYQGWQPTLQALLMPSFGGQMNPVARNVFTAVHIIDPSSKEGLGTVKGLLNLWQRGMPLRIGVVLAPGSVVARAKAERKGQGAARTPDPADVDVPERIARAFHMLFKTLSPKTAFEFLAELGADSTEKDPYSYDYGYGEEEEEEDEYDDNVGEDEAKLTFAALKSAFSSAWASGGKAATTKKARLAAKLGSEEALQQLEEGAGYAQGIADLVLEDARFVLDRGLVPPPPSSGGALLWFNGLVRSEKLTSAMMMDFQYELQRVQMQIYQGQLSDGSNVATQILKNAGAVPRYNPLILGNPKADQESSSPPSGARDVDLPTSGGILESLRYFTSPGTYNKTKAVTHWVAADLDTEEGQLLAAEALKYTGSKAASGGKARAALLHCPGSPAEGGAAAGGSQRTSRLARAFLAAVLRAEKMSDEGNGTVAFLAELLGPNGDQAREALSAVGDDDKAAFKAAMAMAEAAGADSKALLEELLEGGATQGAADAHTAEVCSLLEGALGPMKPGSGSSAVITNGRLVPNGSGGAALAAEDFQLMAVYAEKNQAVKEVSEALHKTSKSLPSSARSNNIMMASSMLRRLGLRDDMRTDETSLRLAAVVEQLRSKAGALLSWDPPGSTSSSSLDITAVVDPLTPGAQKLVSLLLFLRSSFNPRMRVWLNPKLELSELPLKSFFRFALPLLPGDGDDDEEPEGAHGMPGAPEAVFGSGLPQKKILTLNVHAPEAWLVEPVLAPYDTDNLLLADLPEGETMVTADYELEALMITGSCVDVSAKTREQMQPRGVQLHLGDAKDPHILDTLVMSNLGYFQLKGAPGVWSLSLAPGATSALYTVHSSSGISEEGSRQTSDASAATHVVVSSMSGKHMFLKLTKKPGHADDDVLTYVMTPEEEEEQGLLKAAELPGTPSAGGDGAAGEEEEEDEGVQGEPAPSPSPSPSLWGKLVSMLGSSSGAPSESNALRRSSGSRSTSAAGGDEDTVVNIFTVASGHMYERLQKIMILSVLNHTSVPVKFWFIKNYMSPQMKAFLPYFAEEYGFEYELVTYKWPRWLHKQTEKQRIIWAYKILFLDVLFPLNLKKVVFVDADQIIRADMKELIDMDLRGAPYAYTPFCDNNKDMDGYRFWTQGFWKDHLRGRPYHISALYVVDLERFRQTAAGDQLRILYDNLSKDPNSLANLDQDLPNYAQHQVKIHSLPQEWLWCESWCGNSTKPRAKTIDLCNNPMTKEPKLQGARRIVKEWPGYDEEVMAFTARVEAILEGNEAEGEEVEVEVEAAGTDGAASSDKEGEEGGAEGHKEQEAGSEYRHDASEL